MARGEIRRGPCIREIWLSTKPITMGVSCANTGGGSDGRPTTLAPGPPVGGGGWVEDCYQPTTGWGRGVVLVLLLGLCEPLPITRVFGSPETDTIGAGSRLSCSITAAPVGWSPHGGVLSPQGCSPLGPIPLLGSPLTTLLPSRRKPWFLPTTGCRVGSWGDRGTSLLDGAPRATPAPSQDAATM